MRREVTRPAAKTQLAEVGEWQEFIFFLFAEESLFDQATEQRRKRLSLMAS